MPPDKKYLLAGCHRVFGVPDYLSIFILSLA